MSKRFGQTLYPRLYHRLVPSYQPVTETYFVGDLTNYNGSFPSAKQWVVSADTIKFSFYYQFDPHDSDRYKLNMEKGKTTQYIPKKQPLYCPIEKIRILQKRADFFNWLFACTIPKEKIIQVWRKEVLAQLEERDITKNLCYILMIADALAICPSQYRQSYDDPNHFFFDMRRNLSSLAITEITVTDFRVSEKSVMPVR